MRILTRTSLLVILAALVPGCVLLEPTEPYGRVGARTAVGYDRPASFATAEPVKGPVTLKEAIRIALANNPEIAAVRHDIGAAQARRDVALGEVFPKVSVVGGYNYHLDDQRLVPARYNGEQGVFGDDIFSADLTVTMPLFTGGRLISEIKAAELLQKSAEHRLARSREELIFNVSSVFYGILAQRQVIESLEFSRKALQEHLKRIEELIMAQKSANVDRLRIEVRIANLEEKLAQENNLLSIQNRVLANLLGVKNEDEALFAQGELTMTEDQAVNGTNGYLTKALSQHPDYLASRADLEAQAKTVDAARADHWPTVSLQGAYGGRWAAGPSDHPSGTSSSEDVGRIGLVAEFPIFEGGQIDARIREQKAKLAAARERLRDLELQIGLDVETARLNVTSSVERIRATEKAIEQAKESLRIEQEKYDLGKGAIVDVLDAQSALLESQTNYYRALADYKIAQAQLRFATGEEQ